VSNIVQWRSYVGPKFGDWAWESALTYGSVYAPLVSMPSTRLSSSITSSSTSVSALDTSSWPTAGAFWVGPNGSGESWEYIAYTTNSSNVLGGLTRYAEDSEFSGTHTSNAVIRFWWELTSATGTITLSEFMDRSLSVVDWSAELSGVNMPQAALINDHLILIQIRESSGSAWGDWTNELVGWINAPEVQDDYRRRKEWNIRVRSSYGNAGTRQVDGVQAGQTELTRRVSASASSSLTNPYKAAYTGEFLEAEPSLDAQSALDTSLNTLWTSERYIGQTNTPVNPGTAFDAISSTAHAVISQAHVNRYPGQGTGYRWIELTVLDDSSIGTLYIMYSKLFGTAPDEYVQDYYFAIDLSSYNNGDRIIIAENATLFELENPDTDAAAIIDGASLNYTVGVPEQYRLNVTGATTGNFIITDTSTFVGGTGDSNSIAYNATPAQVKTALDNITYPGGRIHCYGSNLPAGPVYIVIEAPLTGNLSGIIRPYEVAPLAIKSGWTTNTTPVLTNIANGNDAWFSSLPSGTVAAWFSFIETGRGSFSVRSDYNVPMHSLRWGSDGVPPGLGDGGLWSSTNTVVPNGIPESQTLRMIFDPTILGITPSESDDYWQSSQIQTPGYNPNGSEWLLFRRPSMSLRLLENINNSYTGTVSIGDLSGALVPDGIWNSVTTTLQIGLEQITVTRSGDVITITGRAANGTSAESHVIGDVVYVIDSGVAVDAFPLTEITLKRLNASLPAIYNAKVYGSRFRQVRTPDQDATLADWTQIGGDISTNTAQDVTRPSPAFSPGVRYQWILIVITTMETQPYRACINGIEITNDSSVYNSNRLLSGADAADVISRVLQNGGVPSAAITDNGSTSSVDNLTTAADYAASVASDLAELTRTRITVNRDSSIDLDPDPIFDGTTSYPAAISTLDNGDLLDWNFDWDLNRTVSQIELLWKDTNGIAQDSVFFPTGGPVADGRRVRVGPYIYANSSAAAAGAEKLFYTRRVPFDISAEIADIGRTYRPGQVHTFTWPVDSEMSAMSRKGVIISADHRIGNGAWKTVVHALQIGRTDRR